MKRPTCNREYPCRSNLDVVSLDSAIFSYHTNLADEQLPLVNTPLMSAALPRVPLDHHGAVPSVAARVVSPEAEFAATSGQHGADLETEGYGSTHVSSIDRLGENPLA